MKCEGCGTTKAIRVVRNSKGQEACDICSKAKKGLNRAKKTGFMFQGQNLHQNSNKALAKQVRQEYLGTSHDERRGRDW